MTSRSTRQGFTTLDELRGLLAVPADADEATFERAGYAEAMRAGNRGAHR